MTDKESYSTHIVEQLFRKHYKILRAYAYRLSGDKDVAEDLVQDVYYDLWKKRDELVMEEAIKFYLFRAIYTKTLNYLNSKSYTEQESFEQTTEERIQQIYWQSHSSNQEDSLIYKELQQEVTQAIDALPEQCRKVFILSRKEELKNREIAEQLGISVKTVEKHITKALSLLRVSLKDAGFILLLPLFL
ncbi:RNA polymerase sigma-70 factor (family 1) [Parabacteroides sp. PFB2-12]|uniref:RNA polymerase sigma-70 factor n=1 Tax=unclassified Parabacteroides TaxID=2649774 RepID=UPI0024746850|nr:MULTISPECIES: RNA polymerase sigma-70 factor [unclassified Parabacteroides]MDH6342581.1 RNA polymerase sigma-70 factor (family 1) [Parabacteroides sp. PM6-13]MDH6390233.1 RNA polymerase sigma-70 factor (family 1) [Parabacteroides sp. PFB2-12]